MKKCLLTILPVVCLLMTMAGCSAADFTRQLEAAEDTMENRMDAVEDTLEKAAPQETHAARRITLEEAQRIAFDHVGLTIDQVQRLRTNFETDDGVPRYDVEFFTDNLEYEFEIDAQTGKILSYDRDERRD